MSPDLNQHETRIALLEQNCAKCSTSFVTLEKKLDKLLNEVVCLKIENAKKNGIRAAIWGATSGGGLFGILKLLGYIIPK